jgi:hypothetical protein
VCWQFVRLCQSSRIVKWTVFCAFSLSLASLVGCNSQSAARFQGIHQLNLDATDDERRSWSAPISKSAGEITITVRPQENDRWQLNFLDSPSQELHYPLQIRVSDQDCDFGHQAVVEFFSQKRTAFRRYLETEVPWGEELHLTVTWDDAGAFTVSVNGETLADNAHSRFSRFALISTRGKHNFQLEYSASPTTSQGTSGL